jgi:hypothetical protein
VIAFEPTMVGIATFCGTADLNQLEPLL